MIRRLSLVLVLALVASLPAWAFTKFYSSGSAGISVTQTNTETRFTYNVTGGDNTIFYATTVVVRSRSTSANTCAIRLGGATATYTTDMEIAPGASLTFSYNPTLGGDGGWYRIASICNTAQTATLDIDAFR